MQTIGENNIERPNLSTAREIFGIDLLLFF